MVRQGRHRFIPFAMEAGGRLGGHASAWLEELARRRVRRSRDWTTSTERARRDTLRSYRERCSLAIHSVIASHSYAMLLSARSDTSDVTRRTL